MTNPGRRTVALSDCALTCDLHVTMWRKQAVKFMTIGQRLSDFLCPVGGAMDVEQF